MSLLPPPAEPRRLGAGDHVPDLAWLDTRGRHFTLKQSAYAGRVSVILTCPAPIGAGAQRELTKLRDLDDKWRALDIQVIAVTPAPAGENAALTAKLNLPFPVLSDASFALGRALVQDPAAKSSSARRKSGACAVAIVDPNRRIEKLIAPAGDGRQAIRALNYCEKRAAAGRRIEETGAAETAPASTGQAPVLILPKAIDRDHCARLVRAFETGQRRDGGVASSEHGSNVAIEKIKVRQDVALADTGPVAKELFETFRHRLFPEIKKVFQYHVTRAETLRLGCYTAESGGHFVPHRDDTTPYTAHRRFAMSINLNFGEYEGGGLRFPEYGPNLYRADTGAAVVFSCSLLHEVTRITRGRRFVLLGFFYSEAEQAIREKLYSPDNLAGQPGS